MKSSGSYLGKDVSTFGSFELQGDTLTGTANKVTGFNQFSSDPNEQEGYYAAIEIEPWDGAKFVSSRKPESQVPLVNDGIVIMYLGKDSPDAVESFDVIAPGGAKKTHPVSVTAAD